MAETMRAMGATGEGAELFESRTNAFPVLDIMISEEFDPAALLQFS